MIRCACLASLIIAGCGSMEAPPSPLRWSAPTPLVGLPAESSASITGDLLDLVYDSSGIVLERTRADLTSPWMDKDLSALKTASGELDSEPRISADGLTLRFRAVVPPAGAGFGVPQGGDAVMVTTRAHRGDPWGAPALDQDFVIIGGEGGIEIPSGLAVATQAIVTVGGGNEIHVGLSRRASTAVPFPAPTLPPELDLAGSEFSPSLTSDQLEVVFVSAADPNTFCGNFACDVIMSATRASADDPFDPPVTETVLDVAAEEHDTILVDDHLLSFLVSGNGGQTFYTATR